MHKHIRKVAVALGLISAILFALPASAAGLTEVQIQAIVNLVASFGGDQATINNVNAALRGQATTGSAPAAGGNFCHTFTYDQEFGSRMTADNNDLDALQIVLIREGFQIDPVDRPLGVWKFGASTLAATRQFQAKYGIPATGFVGPLTRVKLNQLYGCGSSNNLSFTATPGSGAAPLAVKFSARGAGGAYVISYGDNTSDTNPLGAECYSTDCTLSASHTYTSAGVYHAQLLAYGDGRLAAATTVTVGGNVQGSVSVINPREGDTWTIGQSHTITLSSPVTSTWPEGDQIDVTLQKRDGTQVGTLYFLKGGSQSSFTWDTKTMLSCAGAGCANYPIYVTPGQYRIVVQSSYPSTTLYAQSGLITLINSAI